LFKGDGGFYVLRESEKRKKLYFFSKLLKAHGVSTIAVKRKAKNMPMGMN
jgi:hypothetical protein